jgi:hypothetical protein
MYRIWGSPVFAAFLFFELPSCRYHILQPLPLEHCHNMPPHQWANPEELLLLQQHLSWFCEAQTHRTTHRFYDIFFDIWFSRFPEFRRLFPEAGGRVLEDEEHKLLRSAVNHRKEVRGLKGCAPRFSSC